MTGKNNTKIDLETTDLEKDLGVYIDSKLVFKDHINKTVFKANQISGMTRRSFQHLDKQFSHFYINPRSGLFWNMAT